MHSHCKVFLIYVMIFSYLPLYIFNSEEYIENNIREKKGRWTNAGMMDRHTLLDDVSVYKLLCWERLPESQHIVFSHVKEETRYPGDHYPSVSLRQIKMRERKENKTTERKEEYKYKKRAWNKPKRWREYDAISSSFHSFTNYNVIISIHRCMGEWGYDYSVYNDAMAVS